MAKDSFRFSDIKTFRTKGIKRKVVKVIFYNLIFLRAEEQCFNFKPIIHTMRKPAIFFLYSVISKRFNNQRLLS